MSGFQILLMPEAENLRQTLNCYSEPKGLPEQGIGTDYGPWVGSYSVEFPGTQLLLSNR